MKKWLGILCAISLVAFIAGCGAEVPEKLEVQLTGAKGYEGAAKGTAVITGSDVTFNITGLEAGTVYTAFFVNVKSKMFEGIGQEPFTLPVDANGNVNVTAPIKKDAYKRYIRLGVYMNPGNTPVGNPLGVKAKLGALMKAKKPKMVLAAKLR
jgi:uncharacterized alpha/beta hydrolase family protein